jgi:diacylglycerol O-acyltransferase
MAAPRTFGMAVRVYSSLRLAERHPVVHNLVVSNVPGPPVPIYFMGGEVLGLYPLGPVFHGAGLNITVISSNGRLHVGIMACADQVPEPWDLAGFFRQEMLALTNAVG